MILAVDLGSTLLKAAVFDAALARRGVAAVPLDHQYAPGGHVELDSAEAEAACEQAVRGAIADAGQTPEAIRVVAVTSQAQTFTVLDRSGSPKTPFISWQDTRAQEACRRLQEEPRLADFARHASFAQLLPALMICQIAHLQANRPGLIVPDDRLVNLPTYLVEQWTGRAVVDNNLAAMSGLYSLELNDWWPAALEVCRLEKDRLPDLAPIGSVAAQTGPGATKFGLPEDIPLVLAGNDQTAGAFGAELHKTGGLLITLGTAMVAYAVEQEAVAAEAAIIRGPYPGGLHYRMVADGCGYNVVNWLRDLLPDCQSDADLFALAAEAQPGCGGLVFEADLPDGKGTWRNLGLHHGPAQLARSLVESLSRRVAQMVDQLQVDLSRRTVLAAGGGSRHAVWLKILEETLGRPITPTRADPLRGAALMARRAVE